VKFRVDSTWRTVGSARRIVLAGSPYRLFRLTEAGARIAQRIESGDDVASSELVSRLIDAGAIHPDHSADRPDRRTARHTTRHATTPARDGSFDVPVTTHTRLSAQDVTIVTPQLGGSIHDDGRVTVDDGSVPPLRGATVRLDHNRGPGTARNAGRRLATTQLVAFVDADVELLDDESAAHGGGSWLEPLLAHFDDPTVGLVAPRVLGDERSSLDLGDEPARIRAGSRVSYVPAAAIVVRATAFDDVGGFDETLRFGEDVDLVWRLDQAGWRCRYEPASTVWHQPRRSLVERLRQQAGYGSSAAPLALRHPHALAPFRSNGWTAGMWSLVGLGRPVAAIGLAVASSGALIAKLRDVPPGVAFGLAMRGHIASGRQLAVSLRRTWWPILAMSCLFSKQARVIAAAAALTDPRALPTDLAYGWGVWSGMRARRTWDPIVPRLSASPGVR
jgi:mycofactocin glycosyltransferase